MNHSPSTSISQSLIRAQQGDDAARERIGKWLIDEVNNKVQALLKQEKWESTESSIVSQVLIKLVRGNTIQKAPHVGYLRSAIVLAVKEILIDHWRKRKLQREKGTLVVSKNEKLFRKFDEFESEFDELVEALNEMESIDSRKASVIACRFFQNMTVEQAAEELEVSKSTVEADWRIARAWLLDRLRKDS